MNALLRHLPLISEPEGQRPLLRRDETPAALEETCHAARVSARSRDLEAAGEGMAFTHHGSTEWETGLKMGTGQGGSKLTCTTTHLGRREECADVG